MYQSQNENKNNELIKVNVIEGERETERRRKIQTLSQREDFRIEITDQQMV